MLAHAFRERGDHGVSRCVGGMNDPAMAMAAFARQMKAQFGRGISRERHVLRNQPFDSRAAALDDEARCRFVAQAAPGD